MIRILVCGGRDWGDEVAVELVLNYLNENFGISAVVHGAASGADTMAMQWAVRHGVKHVPFPANWGLYGLGAGKRRNRQMLKEGKPDIILAFPGGAGTADMVKISTASKKPVWKFVGWTM